MKKNPESSFLGENTSPVLYLNCLVPLGTDVIPGY